MAEKKEFSDFQTYKCDILVKEDIEFPVFCPTCTKDPSYVEPTWYSTDEAYLDQKNCVYKFNVTKVINDLRLGAEEKKLRTFAITFRNHVQENRDYKRPEVISKIIRTGIYEMLIDLNKEISYRHICSNAGCKPIESKGLQQKHIERLDIIVHDLRYLKNSIINDIADGDVVEFIGVSVEEEAAEILDVDLLDVSTHFEYRLDLDEGEVPSAILTVTLERYDELLAERNQILQKAGIEEGTFNPYGLENYAVIEDIYLPANENPGNIIQFLVSIPAFAVDRIPNSSEGDDGDDDELESFSISGKKIRKQLRILNSAYYLYMQQYAVARYLDNTALYYKDSGLKEYNFETVKIHLKTFPADGKINFKVGSPVFFKYLKDALKQNNFRVDNFQFGGLGKKLARKIKFKVDQNSDEPYVIKKILVDSKECRFKKLKGSKARKLIRYMNNHKFMSAFLSQINKIETELTANQTPEWNDFIPKYAYPEVIIQKAQDKDGISESNERNVLECLFEDAGIDALGSGQIRNYLLEKAISLPKLLAYVFNQRACFQTSELSENNPTNEKFRDMFNRASSLDADMENRFYEKEVDKILEASKKTQDVKKLIEELNTQNEEGAPLMGDDGESRTSNEISLLVVQSLENKPYEQITLEDYSRQIAFYMEKDYGEVLEYLEKTAKIKTQAKVSSLSGLGLFDGEEGSFFTGDSGHPLAITAAELAKEKFNFEDTFVKDLLDFKSSRKFLDGDTSLEKLFSFFGICGFKSLLGSVLECLLGGVSFQQFVAKFIESQLKNLSVEKLGLFVEDLPAEEQAKVYEEVRKALGSVVKPWDSQDDFEQTVDTVTQGQPLAFGSAMFPKNIDEEKTNQYWAAEDAGDQGMELSEWNSKTPSEKSDLIDTYGSPRVDVENPNFTGDFTQSSVGTAVNSVVGAFVKAYIAAIINVVDLDILLDKVKDYPGAQLLKKVLFQFACMTPPLMHPPIAEFLKSFTLQVCDPQVGITFPRLTSFRLSNIWANIKNEIIFAIITAIVVILIEILTNIVLKILELLDGLLCRALEAIGTFTANALGDAILGNGNAMSFRSAMREAFCGPETSEDKVDQLSQSILSGLGYTPTDVSDQAQNILNDNDISASGRVISILSGLMTKEDFLYHFSADRDDYDTTQINLMVRAINASAPEFTPILGTPEQLSNLFSSISNFLSPDQRQTILDSIENPLPEEPASTTLCLTNEDYEQWRQKRRKLYENYGFTDPDGIVNDQDRQLEDDLGDLLDAYTNPLGSINDGVSELLQQPICEDGKGIIPRDTEETKEIAHQVTNDLFKNLQMAIYRDLFGFNGYLNELLSDTKGKSLKRHNFKAYFKRNYVNAEDENDTKRKAKGVFPETVAIHLKNEIEKIDIDFNIKQGTKEISERLEVGIKKRAEVFASAINEDRDEKYTTSKGKTRDLNRKRIKAIIPARKIHKPNFELTFSDGLQKDSAINLFDVNPYHFDITYSDRRNNNPAGEIWNEISIVAGFGEDRGEATIYRNQNYLSNEIIELYGSQAAQSNNPRLSYFKAFMNSKIQVGSPDAPNFSGILKDVYEKVNQLFINQMSSEVVSNPDGENSQGFDFGYKSEGLEKEDLEYVDPEEGSSEYTYDNQEQILGRSKTNNPRVVFLDPEIYGGRYTNPPFMIEPSNHGGWYGFALNLIPKQDFCNKKQIDLIGFPYIKKQVNFYYNNLPADERLQQEEECITEPPFNKIANRQTKANLHGVVIAIARMYLSQVYLNGYTMFSNISFNSKNYSNVLYDFVSDLIEDDLSDTPNRDNAFIRSKLKKENYWLIYLEQAVESYQRLIDYKGVVPPKSTLKALNVIRKVQAFYKQPDKTDIAKIKDGDNNEFKLNVTNNEYTLITDRKYLKFYKHALAYQGWGEAIFSSDNTIKLKYLHRTDRYLKYLRLASKIFCIRLVKKQAMEILSELIKYEADKLYKVLDRKIKPKPPIYSVIPYLLQSDKICVTPKHKYGLRQPLVELNINGEADFGTVHDVQHNIFSANPMRGATQAEEIEGVSVVGAAAAGGAVAGPLGAAAAGGAAALSNNADRREAEEAAQAQIDMINSKGRFIIERYIRVKDKEIINVQVASRDQNLFGVVNMEKFQEYLGNLDQDKKISDYFGDLKFVYSLTVEELIAKGLTLRGLKGLGLSKDIRALTPQVLQQRLEITEDMVDFEIDDLVPIRIKGETGLSYGLRLCYFPPKNVPTNELNVSQKAAIENKAFKLKRIPEIPNSSFMIPLIEAEIQVKDQVLSDVNFFDGPNAFDLYCMFRELEENEEYKFLFNTAIPVPTYMSMFALYSNFGFEASWGLSEDERDKPEDDNDEDEEETDIDGDGDDFDFNLYSKAKRKARKLFVNFYNKNDFLDNEAAGEDDLFEFMRLFNPFKFRLPFRLPWWKRRRLRDYRCEDND